MNRNRYLIFIVIFICIYSLVLLILKNRGYIVVYPSIPIYPNNYEEINITKKLINERTKKDIELFHLTNIYPAEAFVPYVNETSDVLDKMATSQNNIVLFFKYMINRRRPWQIDKEVNPLDHKGTADTPAYPAGHAFQTYYVAKILSKKYPDKKELFHKIALDCDYCRVKAGIHYISDGIFARKLVDHLYNI